VVAHEFSQKLENGLPNFDDILLGTLNVETSGGEDNGGLDVLLKVLDLLPPLEGDIPLQEPGDGEFFEEDGIGPLQDLLEGGEQLGVISGHDNLLLGGVKRGHGDEAASLLEDLLDEGALGANDKAVLLLVDVDADALVGPLLLNIDGLESPEGLGDGLPGAGDNEGGVLGIKGRGVNLGAGLLGNLLQVLVARSVHEGLEFGLNLN